ncbi:hypothetical protein H4R33_001342 [Dimargaris cristalligena]|nr:hypothetical protein H4R33_001342 [Dimargaris cristalligena]
MTETPAPAPRGRPPTSTSRLMRKTLHRRPTIAKPEPEPVPQSELETEPEPEPKPKAKSKPMPGPTPRSKPSTTKGIQVVIESPSNYSTSIGDISEMEIIPFTPGPRSTSSTGDTSPPESSAASSTSTRKRLTRLQRRSDFSPSESRSPPPPPTPPPPLSPLEMESLIVTPWLKSPTQPSPHRSPLPPPSRPSLAQSARRGRGLRASSSGRSAVTPPTASPASSTTSARTPTTRSKSSAVPGHALMARWGKTTNQMVLSPPQNTHLSPPIKTSASMVSDHDSPSDTEHTSSVIKHVSPRTQTTTRRTKTSTSRRTTAASPTAMTTSTLSSSKGLPTGTTTHDEKPSRANGLGKAAEKTGDESDEVKEDGPAVGPRRTEPRITFQCHKLMQRRPDAPGVGMDTARDGDDMDDDDDDGREKEPPTPNEQLTNLSRMMAAIKPQMNEFDVIGDAIMKEISEVIDQYIDHLEASLEAHGNGTSERGPDAPLPANLRSLQRRVKAQIHAINEMWRDLEGSLMEASDVVDGYFAVRQAFRLARRSKMETRLALLARADYLQDLTTERFRQLAHRRAELEDRARNQDKQRWVTRWQSLRHRVRQHQPPERNRPSVLVTPPSFTNTIALLQRTHRLLGTPGSTPGSVPAATTTTTAAHESSSHRGTGVVPQTKPAVPSPRFILRDLQRYLYSCSKTLSALDNPPSLE